LLAIVWREPAGRSELRQHTGGFGKMQVGLGDLAAPQLDLPEPGQEDAALRAGCDDLA
jgi:hypothetical protein